MAYCNMSPGFNITLGPTDIVKMLVPPGIPIPVPAINMGFWMTGVPPVVMVLIDGLPAQNLASMVAVTPIDDELGPLGGLISQVIVSLQKALIGNPMVLQEGMPALQELLTTTTGNLINTIADNTLNAQFQVLGG